MYNDELYYPKSRLKPTETLPRSNSLTQYARALSLGSTLKNLLSSPRSDLSTYYTAEKEPLQLPHRGCGINYPDPIYIRHSDSIVPLISNQIWKTFVLVARYWPHNLIGGNLILWVLYSILITLQEFRLGRIHRLFIATVLFRMVRNYRTTLIRQLQRLTVKIKSWQ